MSTTIEYLNLARAKTGAVSDYALAKKLDIPKQSISNYVLKGTPMGDENALKVAEILEIDPAIVLAAVHIERSKTEAEKTVWTTIYERLGGIAASVLLGIMLNGVNPTPAIAAMGAASLLHNANNIHYTKCRRRKPRVNPFDFMVTQILRHT